MSKCPKCDSDLLLLASGEHYCPQCRASFTEEELSAQSKNKDDELEYLKARVAKLESMQPEQKSVKPVKNHAASPAAARLKKYWPVILIAVLALVALVTLMTCLIGIRGIYVNTEFPNEFYCFTATGFEHHGISGGEEYVDKGSWKVKDGKLYLSYKDNFLGVPVDVEEDYYFAKSGDYKKLLIGESREYMREFKRISLLDYSVISKKVQVDFISANQSFTSQVKIGDIVTAPPRPSNNDYEFMGWYDDPYGYKRSDSKQFTGATRVWEDVTYYANFNNPTNYEVSLTGAINKTFYAKEGDKIYNILHDLLHLNFDFYYNYDTLVDENFIMPAENIIIDCILPDNMFTVVLTGVINDIVFNDTLYVNAGETLLPVLQSAYSNCYFTYWNEMGEDEEIDESYIMPSSHIYVNILDKQTNFRIFITGDIEKTIFIYKNTPVLGRLDDYFSDCSFYYDNTLIDEDFFMPSHDIEVICYKRTPKYNLSLIGAFTGTYPVASGDSVLATLNDILSDYVCYFNDNRIDDDFVMPAKNITVYCFTPQQEQYYTELENTFTFYDSSIWANNTEISGDITIPSEFRGHKITRIGIRAFENCTEITSVTIPDSVEIIENQAFNGCINLKSVDIPDSVMHIRNMAFGDCTNLKDIYILPIWQNGVNYLSKI